MKELTDRQAQVLEYIVKYRHERGIPPAYREIARHFGVSMQAVQRMLVFIRAKGLLTWTEGRARTLTPAG
jgi:repressor LexA